MSRTGRGGPEPRFSARFRAPSSGTSRALVYGVDGFLFVGIALLAGALIPGTPGVVIPAAVCVLWLTWPTSGRGTRLLCVAALALGAGADLV